MLLVLYTKKFPFGSSETYLEAELEFLCNAFEKILIVPYDEYEYSHSRQTRIVSEKIEIFKINNHITKDKNILNKIRKYFFSLKIIAIEFIFGRESKRLWKEKKECFNTLKHLYASAIALENKLLSFGSSKILFYNYWLHSGVIISNLINKKFKHFYPIVSRAHSIDLYHSDWKKYYSLENLFLPFEYYKIKNCNLIYPISKHGLEHLKNTFPKFKNKFILLNLGTNITNNNQLNFSTDLTSITLVSCGAIVPLKRISLIPDILNFIKIKKINWIHFGDGDKELIDSIYNKLEKYGLKNSFILKGNVSNSTVHDFYSKNKVDFFCNISLMEGIPVSLMEASSYGIPLIATNVGGNPEIVNNENGILIPIEFNPEKVAGQIEKIFFNRNEHLKLRNGAIDFQRSHFNAKINYTKFTNVLMNINLAS